MKNQNAPVNPFGFLVFCLVCGFIIFGLFFIEPQSKQIEKAQTISDCGCEMKIINRTANQNGVITLDVGVPGFDPDKPVCWEMLETAKNEAVRLYPASAFQINFIDSDTLTGDQTKHVANLVYTTTQRQIFTPDPNGFGFYVKK